MCVIQEHLTFIAEKQGAGTEPFIFCEPKGEQWGLEVVINGFKCAIRPLADAISVCWGNEVATTDKDFPLSDVWAAISYWDQMLDELKEDYYAEEENDEDYVPAGVDKIITNM